MEEMAISGAASGAALPAGRLLDVSPMALRMSSPFNSSYWLGAA